MLTYLGFEQDSINIHDETGDRPLTTEGDSIFPQWGDGFPTSVFSPDGSRLYYLLHSGVTRAFGGGELWMHDFASRTNQPLLPKLIATSFDISPDGENIVLSALDQGGTPRLWTARLDRRTPPRRIFSGEAIGPVFGDGREIYFRGPEGSQWFVFALNPESGVVRKLIAEPSVDAPAVSPDRNWVVLTVPFEGRDSTSLVKAFPVRGGAPLVLCQRCFPKWSRDQKELYVSFLGSKETLIVPLAEQAAFPKLPAAGLTIENGRTLPGAKLLPRTDVFPGIHKSQYAYAETASNRNVYRLQLPR